MKGFKDSTGKFRPTEKKNGVRKSRDKVEKTKGIRLSRKWDGRTEFRDGNVYHIASSGVDIHHPENEWCMLCDKTRMVRDRKPRGIEPLEPFSLRRREHLLDEDQLSRDFSFDQLDKLKSEIDNDLSTRYFDLNPNAGFFNPEVAFEYAREKGNRLDPDFDILLTERRKVIGATNKKTMRSLGGVVERKPTGFPEVDEMMR